MVCADCEKKKGAVCTPDPWKAGAKGVGSKTGAGGVGPLKKGTNQILKGLKKYQPYASGAGVGCKICKTKLQSASIYCQGCAYKRGVCSQCGKMILDTKFYKQSSK